MSYSDRVEYLVKASNGKKVLHIGCCGLISKLNNKDEKFSHIHEAINRVAATVTGLDIDKGELKEMEALGYENLFYGNIENGYPAVLHGQKFDVIFFGNMFNYIADPIKALLETKEILSGNGRIIITVNNSLSIRSYLRLLIRKTDPAFRHHIFNYSPNTSSCLLERAKARDISVSHCWHGPDIFYKQSRKSKFLTWLFKKFIKNKNLSDTLILDFSI